MTVSSTRSCCLKVFRGGRDTRALFLCARESGEHISSAGPGRSGDLTPPSGYAVLPLREKEVDPLRYGLASLGREQSLLFGDVQHRLGDLVQRGLVHLQASGCEGVARAQFDVAVLEGQEGYEEVDQVAGHQVALSKATWKGELKCVYGEENSILQSPTASAAAAWRRGRQRTLRLHRFGPEAVLQVLHADVLAILPRVPKIQGDIIDRHSTDVAVETTCPSHNVSGLNAKYSWMYQLSNISRPESARVINDPCYLQCSEVRAASALDFNVL